MARLSYASASGHAEDTKLLKNDATTEEVKKSAGCYEIENKQLLGK